MSSDFWTERTVTAKTPHRCESCGETILAREKYVRVAQKYDGTFWAYPLCVLCNACTPCYDYSKHEVEYNVRDMLEWYREELRDAGVEVACPPSETYRRQLLRLCNGLRQTRNMSPLEIAP